MKLDDGPLFAQLDRLGFAIFLKSASGQYLTINTAGETMIDMPPCSVAGLNDLDIFEKSSAQQMMERDEHIRQSREVARYTSIAKHHNQWSRFETIKLPVTGNRSQQSELLGISLIIDSKLIRETDMLYYHIHHLAMSEPEAFYKSYLAWQALKNE